MLFTIHSAVRAVRRAPMASVVVMLSVALGVGSTTTVSAWMEHLIRRPLPAVEAMDRVVSVESRTRGRDDGLSYPALLDMRGSTTTVEDVAAFGMRQFGVRRADEGKDAATSVWGLLVTSNYFDVLRVRPASGRFLVAADARSVWQLPVVVVSHRLARRLGGADHAPGAQVRVNGALMTVVGVAPPDFGGTYTGLAFDVWVPVTANEAVGGDPAYLQSRSARWLRGIARLRDGASLAAARDELAAVGAQLARRFREDEDHELFLEPLDTGAAQRLATLFTVLLGMTTLVALIVCTNVANLLLLRGAARSTELGIRLGLGASRAQLIAQLFAESMILAGAGAVLGVVFALYAQELLPALMPPSPLPLAIGGHWDLSMVLFAAGVAAAMVMVFSLAPAAQTLRGSLLSNSSRGSMGATRRSARLRTALVVVQLALSMAALACCGAFLRVNGKLADIDRGIARPADVLIVSTQLDQAGYRTDAERVAVAGRLLEAMRAFPGVHSAAAATFVPLGFVGYSSLPIAVDGYTPQPEEDPSVLVNRVSEGYFETLGIQVRSGRPIDGRDTALSAAVLVVNEAFVRRYFGATAVGQRVRVDGREMTVVGTAADGKYQFDALDKPAPPFAYLPYTQHSRAGIILHIRAPDRHIAASALRRAVAAVDPALPLDAITTLEEYTSLPLFPVRLATTVLGWLGTVALLLAATGLYGVLSYRVVQRRREIALRMAVGADHGQVLRLILRDGVTQALAGLAIGGVVALALTRAIAARLPRVTAVDPPVLAMSAVVLLVVAIAAACVPALRAMRIEAAVVLKND
jgi:putative ABC transport system permease protein